MNRLVSFSGQPRKNAKFLERGLNSQEAVIDDLDIPAVVIVPAADLIEAYFSPWPQFIRNCSRALNWTGRGPG